MVSSMSSADARMEENGSGAVKLFVFNLNNSRKPFFSIVTLKQISKTKTGLFHNMSCRFQLFPNVNCFGFFFLMLFGVWV